jgi:phage shock protein C
MTRRLYRSRTDSVLGGVAGGVAEYLDADPSIVRIIWAILAIVTGGIFLVLYIVMWIVVPETPDSLAAAAPSAPGATPAAGTAPVRRERRASGGGAMVFGLILVGLGAYFLIDEYLPQVDVNALWPVALVILGLVLLVNSLRGRTTE